LHIINNHAIIKGDEEIMEVIFCKLLFSTCRILKYNTVDVSNFVAGRRNTLSVPGYQKNKGNINGDEEIMDHVFWSHAKIS
jgi:hypothetical protein